jgi:hypothetical protein
MQCGKTHRGRSHSTELGKQFEEMIAHQLKERSVNSKSSERRKPDDFGAGTLLSLLETSRETNSTNNKWKQKEEKSGRRENKAV